MTDESEDRSIDTPEAVAADLIVPLLGCGLALYYLLSTAELAWEARATGTMIAIVLLGLCGLLFLRTGLQVARGACQLGFGDLFENSSYNRQRLALIALLIVFIASIPWLGTTLGLFFLLLGALYVLGVREAKVLLGISLAASSIVYLLFIFLLNSRLPRGVLEDALANVLPSFGG